MNLYSKALMVLNKETQLAIDISELNKIRKYLIKQDVSCVSFNLHQIEDLWYAFSYNRCAGYLIIDIASIQEFVKWIEDEFEWL